MHNDQFEEFEERQFKLLRTLTTSMLRAIAQRNDELTRQLRDERCRILHNFTADNAYSQSVA